MKFHLAFIFAINTTGFLAVQGMQVQKPKELQYFWGPKVIFAINTNGVLAVQGMYVQKPKELQYFLGPKAFTGPMGFRLAMRDVLNAKP